PGDAPGAGERAARTLSALAAVGNVPAAPRREHGEYRRRSGGHGSRRGARDGLARDLVRAGVRALDHRTPDLHVIPKHERHPQVDDARAVRVRRRRVSRAPELDTRTRRDGLATHGDHGRVSPYAGGDPRDDNLAVLVLLAGRAGGRG